MTNALLVILIVIGLVLIIQNYLYHARLVRWLDSLGDMLSDMLSAILDQIRDRTKSNDEQK